MLFMPLNLSWNLRGLLAAPDPAESWPQAPTPGEVMGGWGCLRAESSKEQKWEGLRDQTKVSQSGIWKKVGLVCGELHWGVSGRCFKGAAGRASWVM